MLVPVRGFSVVSAPVVMGRYLREVEQKMGSNNLPEPIPAFEGRPVDGIIIKVGGSAPLDDLGETVLGIDDRVQLLSIYTVTGVRHVVDSKTGNLVREQTLKPVEMHLMPFDENDPTDDGVIRALPQGTVVHGGNSGADDDED